MNSDERDKIKTELQNRIRETKKIMTSLEEQAKPVPPDNAIGRITRMDAIQQRSVAEANLRTQEEKLYKLEDALSKVGQDGFGFCIKCQKSIPLGRILIMPESKICVACASNPQK